MGTKLSLPVWFVAGRTPASNPPRLAFFGNLVQERMSNALASCTTLILGRLRQVTPSGCSGEEDYGYGGLWLHIQRSFP